MRSQKILTQSNIFFSICASLKKREKAGEENKRSPALVSSTESGAPPWEVQGPLEWSGGGGEFNVRPLLFFFCCVGKKKEKKNIYMCNLITSSLIMLYMCKSVNLTDMWRFISVGHREEKRKKEGLCSPPPPSHLILWLVRQVGWWPRSSSSMGTPTSRRVDSPLEFFYLYLRTHTHTHTLYKPQELMKWNVWWWRPLPLLSSSLSFCSSLPTHRS